MCPKDAVPIDLKSFIYLNFHTSKYFQFDYFTRKCYFHFMIDLIIPLHMCLYENNLLHKNNIFVCHDLSNFKTLFLEIFQNEQFIFLNRFPQLCTTWSSSSQIAKQFKIHKQQKSNQFFNIDGTYHGAWQSRDQLYLYGATIFKYFLIKQFQIVKNDCKHFLLIKRRTSRQIHPNVKNLINTFCLNYNIKFQAVYLEKYSF